MKNRSLISYVVTGRWGVVAVCWLLGVAGSAVALVMPNAVGHLTNLLSRPEGARWGPVNRTLLALVGAQLALSVLTYFRRRTEAVLHEAGARTLLVDVLARVIRFPADFFRDHVTEKIVARVVEDSQKVSKFYLDALVSVPLALLSVALFGGLMLLGNLFLGACMIPLSLLTGYFILFDRRIQRANTASNEAAARLRTEAAEIIAGVSEIRNHAAFDHAVASLDGALQARRRSGTEIGRLNALFMSMGPVMYTIQSGVLYWIGAGLCIAGSSLAQAAGALTWGDVIQFMLLAGLFQRPISEVAEFGLRWRMAGESLNGLRGYLGRECAFASTAEAAPASPPEVGLEHVSVTAPSGAKIVEDVSLRVPAGRRLALAGPAGCGKSTLIQLLTRGTDASGGRVLVGGRDAKDVDVVSAAREIGLVPQKPVLFNTSLRNNLLLGLRRPSTRTLKDGMAEVDVSRHGDVRNVEELNRELVRAVRDVGLEKDVLRKCLENLAPEGAVSEALRRGMSDLRREIRAKLAGDTAALVVAFDPAAIVPGTVAENLFGPQRDAASKPAERTRRLARQLPAGGALEELVRFGWLRYLSERALAVRTLQRAPQLMQFLPAGRTAGGLEGELKAGLGTLGTLPADVRNVLLEIALEGPIGTIPEPMNRADFEQQLVAVRKALWNGEGGVPRAWTPVDESGYVDGLTVGENILWGRVAGRILGAAERVDEIIRQVLEERGLLQAALVMGLECRVGEDGKFLSGGQRQKVAIARVLLKRPGLLLMDEATASLDELSQSKIVDLVDSRFAGQTVISISHRLSTVRHYDRIAVLDRGQVVQQGTYDELAAQEGLFRNLLRQAGGPAETRVTARVAAARTGAGVEGELLRRSLALSPVFASLSGDQLVFLERVARVARCPLGHTLFRRGDPGSDLFLILEGEVEFFLEVGEDGARRTETINTYGPGRVFGELALFGDGVRTAGARARTELLLCVISREDLLRLIAADPQIAVGLLKGVARRMAEITDEAAVRKP